MADSEHPDSTAIQWGRRYVFAAIVLLVVANLTITTAYVARLGTNRLPQQAGRLFLLLILGFYLLRGYQWARWLTVILLLLGVWNIIPLLIAPGAFTRGSLPRTLPALALFVGYGIVVRGFLYSKSVRTFFRARTLGRRARDTPPSGPSPPAA